MFLFRRSASCCRHFSAVSQSSLWVGLHLFVSLMSEVRRLGHCLRFQMKQLQFLEGGFQACCRVICTKSRITSADLGPSHLAAPCYTLMSLKNKSNQGHIHNILAKFLSLRFDVKHSARRKSNSNRRARETVFIRV